MELTSFSSAVFIAAVFGLYWGAGRRSGKLQNGILLLASGVFYWMADHRFLILLLFSALVNYGIAIGLGRIKSEHRRSLLFHSGVALDLGLLCWFKYMGFFRPGIEHLLHGIGFGGELGLLSIALPLGISFYTFQMLGYLIDVHNEETEACTDPLGFLTYVFFFPKIMAGPIERAQRFLPQVATARVFHIGLATDGLRQILWGLLAKVVIADNASTFVDIVFRSQATASASTLAIGALLYFIQIYCDFSGYSNMAIGISKLFGIRLMTNFNTPFFAMGVNDFWKRWHISLTTWMIDHVFTPLSFILRDLGRAGTVISISITFLAVGIWHGANWTFVVFGALQSLLFMPLALTSSINRSTATVGLLPSAMQVLRMAGTFVLMMLCFVLLRSASLHDAITYYHGLVGPGLFSKPSVFPTTVLVATLLFLTVEWVQRGRAHALDLTGTGLPTWVRWCIYSVIIFMLALLNNTGSYQFIYFQF
jgi:D-alanyl-lipoteichoic acid acyltransferase DltB (MBOAT superfamily)